MRAHEAWWGQLDTSRNSHDASVAQQLQPQAFYYLKQQNGKICLVSVTLLGSRAKKSDSKKLYGPRVSHISSLNADTKSCYTSI